MRSKIFISYADPGDNDLARWLSLQLIRLGYEVWCDIFNEKKSPDISIETENEIRKNTAKFLYILTNNSNHNEKCLKELAFAGETNKKIHNDNFITVLLYDPEICYEETNDNLKRKNHLDFKSDWRKGLNDLIKTFTEDPAPVKKEKPDFNFIKNYWSDNYLNNKKPVRQEEKYTSNWFPFIKLPANLYFHDLRGMIPQKFDWGKVKYPTCYYKKYTATFGSHRDFIDVLPETQKYVAAKSRIYDVQKILKEGFEDDFVRNKTLKNIINALICAAFEKNALAKGLTTYEMFNDTFYCFKDDIYNTSKNNLGRLTGKQGDRKWHFAVNGFSDFVHNAFVIRSHVIFADSSDNLIKSRSIQQLYSGKQGKNWGNQHWKDKLSSAVEVLCGSDHKIKLRVGAKNFILIGGDPLIFQSTVSYNYLDETQDDLSEYYLIEEDIEEDILL